MLKLHDTSWHGNLFQVQSHGELVLANELAREIDAIAVAFSLHKSATAEARNRRVESLHPVTTNGHPWLLNEFVSSFETT